MPRPPWPWRRDPTVRFLILQSEGKWAEAERHIRFSMDAWSKSRQKDRTPNWLEKRQLELSDNLLRQGRLVEAEVTAREVLSTLLGRVGRTNLDAAMAVLALAEAVHAQNRHADALKLAEAARAILDEIGAPPGARLRRVADHLAGRILLARREMTEALALFDRARHGLDDGDFFANTLFRHSPDAILALAAAGRAEEAVPLAEDLSRSRAQVYGPASWEAAEAGGVRAYAEFCSGRGAATLPGFRRFAAAIDNRARGTGTDPARIQLVVEGYVSALAEAFAGSNDLTLAAEAFAAAELGREGQVRKAVEAAARRAAATSPEIAALVRNEQDLERHGDALRGHLARLSATVQTDEIRALGATLRGELERVETSQSQLTAALARAVPASVAATRPIPADAARALRSGEVMVATMVAADRSFIWAVDAAGTLRFAVAPAGRKEIGRLVAAVRESTEMRGDTLASVPVFDFASAHRLYSLLLQPVAAGWKDGRTLVVVPDAALGFLPIPLLTTDQTAPLADKGPLFAPYRRVPWLARTHAVATIPSVTALIGLRRMQAARPERRPFIGFGDPLFGSAPPPALQVASTASRGVVHRRNTRMTNRGSLDDAGIGTVRLPMLVPLPETADEVLAVAASLGADASRDVFLGARATEDMVKRTPLADRKVVMFATHGLVAGDLDGLMQPALALSNPAGGPGDGLLTMEEVLGLRLDADWVVLSACNTAAADGGGVEAVSGLGRAFFYAGTRALLATHWAVETESARLLTSEVFKRQGADPSLSRAEALRLAMVAVMDGPGIVEDGRTVATYAHPFFWAPFALFGDGGG